MAAMPDWFIWTHSGELGQAILVAREAAGLTQAQLARRAGVDRKLLYRLESGKANPRMQSVMRVLAALGLMPLILPVEALSVLR